MFLNHRHRLARIQHDPSELRVVEFQRVTGLLDMPVTDPGPRRCLREERLDFGTPKLAARTSWKPREEASDPADAERDRFLLRPSLLQNLHVPLRPLRFRNQRRGHLFDQEDSRNGWKP